MSRRIFSMLVLAWLPLACDSAPPEPKPEPEPDPGLISASGRARGESDDGDKGGTTTSVRSTPSRRVVQAKPVAEVRVSPDDPVKGKFTLDDATAGLPGDGPLVAKIQTDVATLECDLYADKAPITVANFVGLARGLRPWKNPKKEWVKKPAYDGTTFHRIIRGFMIQGGDPTGTGAGNPGYVIPDEIWEGAHHDERGLLCMANRGPNTNAMQFFVLDGPAPHLDGGYTIFGKCGPSDAIQKLAGVETRGERPVSPPKIQHVTISRRAGAEN